MIRVRLSFVPPGGGEVDYGLTINMPALPREGDYISIVRKVSNEVSADNAGSEDFIVRRVWWFCSYSEDGVHTHIAGEEPVGTAEVCVECEFAIGPMSSPSHKRAAATKKARASTREFEDTNY
jgi:hypothetical protein